MHEISARLRAEGTPLNRTGVGQILAEEGFGRLLRGPAPEASASPATAGRDTRLPRAAVIDFAAFPARAETRLAGLLLALPDLVALDLPALTSQAGYPGTSVIPAVSWLLSLLALKLTGTRRVSHVDDLLDRPGQRPVRRAGRAAEEIRAHRLLLPARPRPPAAAPGRPGRQDDQRRAGHRRRGDLRPGFPRHHALGPRPGAGKALRPARSQRARSVLTFFAQDTGTHNLVYANADISKATQNREAIAFCDHWKQPSPGTTRRC